MKGLTIRAGSIFLCVIMLLCFLPATAFADTTNEAGINGQEYATLEEAFADAQDGDTVTLLKDITKEGPGSSMSGQNQSFYQIRGGGTITLDLNGCTLTMNGIGQMSQTYGGIELYDRSLTIQDSRGGGAITGSSRWGGGSLIYVNAKTADGGVPSVLTLKSGTLSLTAEEFVFGGTDYAGQCNNSVIRVHNGGVFNMEGGTVQTVKTTTGSGDYCSGAVFVYGGAANLNGGSISAQGSGTVALLVYDNPGDGYGATVNLGGTAVTSEAMGAQVQYDGVLNIKGGSIQAGSYGVTNFGGAVDVTGGEIHSNGYGIYNYAYASGYDATVTISGGYIYDQAGRPVYQVSTSAEGAAATTSISGGEFSHSVEEYVIDGLDYELFKSNQMYSYYPSLEEALKEAEGESNFTITDTGAADSVEVTFREPMGKQVYSLVIGSGSSIALPELSQEGYRFDGWRNAETGEVLRGSQSFDVDTTLEAQWRSLPIQVVITVSDPSNVTYDGTPQTPAVTVRAENAADFGSQDYTVTYENNVNAGTATVVVAPAEGSDYTFAPVEKTFVIAPKTPEEVTVSPISVTYTGKQLDDGVLTGTVKDGGKTVAGTWRWKTQPTEVGIHTAEAVFTPDSPNYAPVTVSVKLVIQAAETPATEQPGDSSQETTDTQAPGQSDIPATGEGSGLVLWSALLLLSGAGALGLTAVRRKNP